MSNTLQIKRGERSAFPALDAGELCYATDENALYISGGGTPQRLMNHVEGDSDGDILYWDTSSTPPEWVAGDVKQDKLPSGANWYDILYWDNGEWKVGDLDGKQDKLPDGTQDSDDGSLLCWNSSYNGWASWNFPTDTLIYYDGTYWTNIPKPSNWSTGDYVLMSKGGTMQWVELEEFTCP